MRLIIVRHGETLENKTGIMQGQTHGTLSQKGLEQAIKVAERLKDEKIDIVYSSDLKRAVDTTKEILKFHENVPVFYVKALRELSNGIFEGKPIDFAKEQEKKSDIPFYKYKWEGGENWIEMQERVVKFYKDALKKHPKKTGLIVSHGGAITSLLLYLRNDSLQYARKHLPKNTAITIVEISDDKKHEIKLMNCIKHLE